MQQGLLFSLFLSLLFAWTPASAVEVSSTSQQKLLQDNQLQQKVSELVDLAIKDDIDALSFAVERISLPQQEAARFLLLQHLEQHQVSLSENLFQFVEKQKNIVPVYQVLEKGQGYEFSVPAFDYIAIAHRLTKQWKKDQSVVSFMLKAEGGELNLQDWLTGPDYLVQQREDLLLSEFVHLSDKVQHQLVKQLTDVKVVSWLPSSTVMVKMAQVTGYAPLYKLLWLMRADFYVEQELERLAQRGDDFSIQQIMLAADNPRLATNALQCLVKIPKPFSNEVKQFLVKRLENSADAPIVAQALAEQGYQPWLKELLNNNRRVESQAILQVLTP
ncbi:hypothetical protein [Vibrio ziniensis]|uniref:HEAT repeat domain-containing protein n=1 Tax=Vibrio ziniensis TaxID=2711221 RepID=A0A6G7CLF4_9VIBR|nr:hypothetical protein [Vibrio ziniensis]QIH42932.1 hypothetical protein G5S32_13675 [Vibrio ziniensis]